MTRRSLKIGAVVNVLYLTGGKQRGLFVNKPALLVGGLLAAYLPLMPGLSDRIAIRFDLLILIDNFSARLGIDAQ